MKIKVESAVSPGFTPKHGVPQGSPLSPLLFIIYVADIPIPKLKSINQSQYADDIAVWVTNKDPQRNKTQLENHLGSLEKWCNNWRIGLNPSKTKQVNFRDGRTKRTQKNQTNLYNTPIEICDKARFLGIIMDKGLHLEDHYKNILKETQHIKIQLYRLNNAVFKVPKKMLIYLYDCFIRSQIEYCPIMFLLANDKVKEKLESEHRRFLKVIFNLDRRTSKEDVYRISNTTSLEERIQKLAANWFQRKMEDENFQTYISNCKCYGQFDRYNTIVDILSKIINQD